jgi:hypothetical protein
LNFEGTSNEYLCLFIPDLAPETMGSMAGIAPLVLAKGCALALPGFEFTKPVFEVRLVGSLLLGFWGGPVRRHVWVSGCVERFYGGVCDLLEGALRFGL